MCRSDSVLLLADSTAHGWNGAIAGTAGMTAVTGRAGGGAGFAGSGQYINIGDMGARPSQGTISMWVKAPALTNYPNSFSTGPLGGNTCGNAGIRFELNSSANFGAMTGADDSTCSNGHYSGVSMTTYSG